MDPEKRGIEELKDVIKLVVVVAEVLFESLKDGKLGLSDLMRLFDVAQSAGPAFKGFSKVGAEIADLSEAEKAYLHSYIAKEFDIDSDRIEGYIEKVLQAVVSMLDLIPFVGKKK